LIFLLGSKWQHQSQTVVRNQQFPSPE
jgi:hypothetical protein